MISLRLGIDTLEVIKVAAIKWNFPPFKSGLVWGHRIGVDPYWLTHKGEQLRHPSTPMWCWPSASSTTAWESGLPANWCSSSLALAAPRCCVLPR